jgi:hypothetical protein
MYTRILAPLRDRDFDSLEALNEAVWELLDAHNAKRFQKLPASRKELFESIDKPALKPLPERRYELTSFKTATVGFNYHVGLQEENHFYSVPYAYARKEVTIAYTNFFEQQHKSIWHTITRYRPFRSTGKRKPRRRRKSWNRTTRRKVVVELVMLAEPVMPPRCQQPTRRLQSQ